LRPKQNWKELQHQLLPNFGWCLSC
jgi:hypothetical protein